jgi:hypothetical protein
MNSVSMLKVMAAGAVAFSAQLAFAHGAKALDDGLTLSATCSCRNAGDCTCKKGQCKCPKCGNHVRSQVIEPLGGTDRKLELPKNARYEATGGVFI